MKKQPLFSIATQNTVLPRASRFGILDDVIRSTFDQKRIYIESGAPILETKKRNEWRIVSEKNSSIDAYRLRLLYDVNVGEERVEVYRDSVSGLPLDLWGFRIFTSNLHSPGSRQKFYYTGEQRSDLTGKKKLKWDYFFRPDVEILSNEFDNLISEYEDELISAKAILKRSWQSIGILAALLFGGYLGVTYDSFSYGFLCLIFAFFMIIYMAFSLVRHRISLNTTHLKQDVKNLKLYLKAFNEEKNKVFGQLEEIQIPIHEDVQTWLNEEIGHMEEESKNKYVFSDKIQKQDVLSGLGIYQPEFRDIASQFPNRINSFFGFRYAEGKLLYSGLFLVFVFQTDKKICITKFFYDFILSKKYREENLEYHYTDLVGVAIKSKLVNNPFKDNDIENKEINTIWMSFMDSNNIEIAIIDKDTSDSIADRMIDTEEYDEGIDLDFFEEDIDEGQDKKADLSMSKANKIIRNIKDKKLDLNL